MKPKSEQVLAIQAVYDMGRTCNFVWLPTGFEKSFCYEALPFVADWKRGRVDSKPTSTSDTHENFSVLPRSHGYLYTVHKVRQA